MPFAPAFLILFSVGGFSVMFPRHLLGLAGMPRRIPDYAMQFTDWNRVSAIGGWVYGVVARCAEPLVDPDGEELLRIKLQ